MIKKGIFKRCKWCKKEFYVKRCLINKKFFCIKECYSFWQKGKLIPNSGQFIKGQKSWNKGKKRYWHSPTEFKKGKLHPFFKGFIKHQGYILLHVPNHPHNDRNGYVKRSRLVMERHLGRHLKPKEVIHHINHIRDDDRINNLILLNSNSEHSRLHNPKGFNPLRFYKTR